MLTIRRTKMFNSIAAAAVVVDSPGHPRVDGTRAGRSTTDKFIRDFLAAGVAACAAETITAPIERTKIILQVQASNTLQIDSVKRYKGMIDCFVRIPREQGFLSFWRGNLANVIRYFFTQAINFSCKERYKLLFVPPGGVDRHANFMSYFFRNVASGAAAGATGILFVYPLDFARTRLAADVASIKAERQFKGLTDCLTKTVATDGFRGLYRGCAISVPGIIVYRGAYFGLFDTFNEPLKKSRFNSLLAKFALAQFIANGSGFLAYPFDTVRRRMMMQSNLPPDQRQYSGTIECIRKIYRYEGVAAFYKGAASNVLRGISGALVLVLYDEFRRFL